MQDSPAVRLMSHLWGNSQEATGHSYLRLNQGLREGLFLAVKIGLKFKDGDIAEINKRFRGGYWFGDNFESFYTCAVVYANRSAWKAYEAHVQRKPFIWTPARLRATWGGGGQGINNPSRLTVGCEIEWKGERVTITSFNDEKGYFVAQSYVRDFDGKDCPACGRPDGYAKDKILHRFSISHDDLMEEKKRTRERATT